MASNHLLQLTDFALSRNTPSGRQTHDALSSPTLSVETSILPTSQQMRRSSSLPRFNPDAYQFDQNPLRTSQHSRRRKIPLQKSPTPSETHNQTSREQPPAELLERMSALLSEFGYGIHQLHPPTPPSISPAPSQSSSECVPRRQPSPLRQSMPDSGAVGVRFAIPATGQRTGSQPSPTPLATTSSTTTSPLPLQKPAWDEKDRDLLLKSANRPRFTEQSGVRIRAFVEDAENFLEMCGRPRDRWSRFILSWLGVNEAEKVRRSHFIGDDITYDAFRDGLFTLFGRLDFEDAYREQLRVLTQSGAESIAAFASRTSDLTSRAYPSFSTDVQLDLAVNHFISGLRDSSSRDYLRRERARRRIQWQETVQMAQACEIPRAAEYQSPAAAAITDAITNAKSANFAHNTTSCNDCAIAAQGVGNSGNPRTRGKHTKSRAPTEYSRSASSNPELFGVAQPAPKVRWTFDPRNGAPLRAPLEMYIPKSQWCFSPYTGLAMALSPRQYAPSPSNYAPLQQSNQYAAQHTSRFQNQQSTSQYHPAVSSSTPRFSYPSTSSGNFPPPLPLTYEGSQLTQQSRQQQSNRSSSTVNAVNSAGRGAPQLFADVTLNGSVVHQTLIDTGATFSMVPMRTLTALTKPSLC